MDARSGTEDTGEVDGGGRREADFGRRGVAGLVALAALTVALPRYDPEDAALRDAFDVAGLVAGAAFWLLLLWLAFGRQLRTRLERRS